MTSTNEICIYVVFRIVMKDHKKSADRVPKGKNATYARPVAMSRKLGQIRPEVELCRAVRIGISPWRLWVLPS